MEGWGFERPELVVPAMLLAIGSGGLLLAAGYFQRRGGNPEKMRRCMAVGCRLLTLALLAVMMSAPTHRAAKPETAAIAFVVDASERLAGVRERAYEFIDQAVDELPGETLVGVSLADDEMEWLEIPGTRARNVDHDDWDDSSRATAPGRFVTTVDRTARHLAPGDKLVLLTDGRSDRHSLLEVARRLRQKGISTYVHPVAGEGRSGVFIESVTGPVLLREGDQATFRVALQNVGSDPAQVDLGFLLRREGEERVELRPLEGFRCEPGRCVAEYDVFFPMPGNAWVGVTLSGGIRTRSDEDALGELQKAWFPCMVRATPEILVVAGMPGAADLVMQSLRRRGAEISGRRLFETGPDRIPDDPEALRRYGSIVLVNVEASAPTPAQTDALGRYVAEHGGGLVAFGGIQAFDRGGYAGSGLEELLPVKSKPKPTERKKLTFGLLFVIDASGSVAGDLGSTQASIERLVRSVPLESTIGIIVFDAKAEVNRRLALVKTLEQRDRLLARVGDLSAGGGTVLASGLEAALREISRVESRAPSGHASGHVIILSDGHLENGGGDNAALDNLRLLVREMAAKGWQVSCIGIGGPDETTLKQIALAGNGHYSTYPLIPRLGSDTDPDARFTYTLSTQPGEPVFGLDDHEPLPLGSVTQFNRLEGLKPWGRESLLVDHRKSPWGLAFGHLGRGTSVAALYDVTSAWSFPMLEGEFRDTLLAQPVLFSLRGEAEELHLASLDQGEDGRWNLVVETADDTAPKLDVRLEGPFQEEHVPIVLELPRFRRHTYGAPVPSGVVLAGVLRADIASRPDRNGDQLPAVRVPVAPRRRLDVEALRGRGPDHEAITEFLRHAAGFEIHEPSGVSTGEAPLALPETQRFWSPFLAIAVVLAVAADAASRTWCLRWSLVLYATAGLCTVIALFGG